MTWTDLFEAFTRQRVAVIGDVMLDVYWWGHVERISPEAPVPVVSLERSESRLGGAANVALNLKALGAHPEVFAVVGSDEQGRRIRDLLQEAGIGAEGLFVSDHRPSTSKSRIISRHQHMLRLDSEVTQDLNQEEEASLLALILSYLERERPDAVILEDYNKGVLTQSLIREVLDACQRLGIPSSVDPKQRNFLAFQGASIFKPNLKEVREGLHLSIDPAVPAQLDAAHEALKQTLNHEVTFITLSERGVYVHDANSSAVIPSHLRNISDVSGAGDTVIATATLTWAATRRAGLMAELANLAGGLVCEQVGVVAIDPAKLKAEARETLGPLETIL